MPILLDIGIINWHLKSVAMMRKDHRSCDIAYIAIGLAISNDQKAHCNVKCVVEKIMKNDK
jgi:hypothetical protein